MSISLGFIAPGLTEEIKFDEATWNTVMNRPTFEGNMVGTILWQLLNQVENTTSIYQNSKIGFLAEQKATLLPVTGFSDKITKNTIMSLYLSHGLNCLSAVL